MDRNLHRVAATLFAFVMGSGVWAACDRTPTRPDHRYSVVEGSEDNEILDQVSGLIWQRCALGKTWDRTKIQCVGDIRKMSWQVAMEQGSKGQGKSNVGWRLPQYIELLTLVDISCSNPAVNARWFGDKDIQFLWSASPYGPLADYAWGLKYARGEIIYDSKIEEFQVRLVRSLR